MTSVSIRVRSDSYERMRKAAAEFRGMRMPDLVEALLDAWDKLAPEEKLQLAKAPQKVPAAAA